MAQEKVIYSKELIMTEYWQSQARKYCEFCKCWFADNKVSISFHENGKKHKESVKKHISQLSKRSAKEFKAKEKLDNELQKMEKAAMTAYLKDVQNNADLTSKNINEMLEQDGCNSDIIAPRVITNKEPLWQEVKNDDGKPYFWNKETNETTWDEPDNYLSIAQQEEEKLRNDKKQKKILKEKQKEAMIEVKAHLVRERMKELAAKPEKPAPTISSYGPEPRSSKPYGKWETVVQEPVEKIDLQLPKKEVHLPPVVVEPEVVKFKEKRVDSLGDGPVEFKKRKINNAKRNIRQKLNDE